MKYRKGEENMTSLLQVRIDDTLKTKASEVFEKLGIDLPTAVRIFLKRSVIENGIPFSMKLPDENTAAQKAIEALDRIQEFSKNSLSDISLDEINAEIDAARKVLESGGDA